MLLGLLGSPDGRQIDGLGGAQPQTSKVAIIGPPSRADADVDFTFGQVGIGDSTVEFAGNCGNLSAAVGPYAIQEGLIQANASKTVVRIHDTNTHRIIVAHVPMKGEDPAVEGSYELAGVPGTGAPIFLDYSDTVGTVTGHLFPTGNLVDCLDLGRGESIQGTLADVANPVVYIAAESFELSGVESPEELRTRPEVLARLERTRCVAAVSFGLASSWEDAARDAGLLPLLVVVQSPQSYVSSPERAEISSDEIDIVVRMFALGDIHPTYAGTGTANLGAAAMVPGTIVNDVLSERAQREGVVRFGHPNGVSVVHSEVAQINGEWTTRRLGYERTARRIMEGYAYVRRDRLYGG
jgi:2-methylaconitate cis-trans-isomerase PrpF